MTTTPETEHNIYDLPQIFEIVQLTWSNGKGQKSILYIEAFSLEEAVQLSGGGDGIHEVIEARQIGWISIRSPKLRREITELRKFFSSIDTVSKKEEYSSTGTVNVTPDRVKITADMPITTYKYLTKHTKNDGGNVV